MASSFEDKEPNTEVKNDISAPRESPLFVGNNDHPNNGKTWSELLFSFPAFVLGTNDRRNKRITCERLLIILCVVVAIAIALIRMLTHSNGDVELSIGGVVTCDDGRCSKAGELVLQRGGHAIDAAIATALCIGVVSNTESGIGAGALMVVFNASSSEADAYDMRDVAPAAASKDMYKDNPNAQNEGPLSMAVPGQLAGLYEAWQKYGRLPWASLFEPAIDLSRNGFKVSRYLAMNLEKYKTYVLHDPGLRKVYSRVSRNHKRRVLKEGEMCYNKNLARSLREIARHNPTEAFFNGPIGQLLVQDVRDMGGILTMDDLRNYRVNVTPALTTDVMGYKIFGMHPPASGTLGLTMVANIINNYKSSSDLEGPLGLHRLIEAMKHMLVMRMKLGDPFFSDLSEVINNMTSLEFAKEKWDKIDDSRTYPPEYYESRYNQVIDHGTAHLAVVDLQGNVVALTSSLGEVFGAKNQSISTGIVINNAMSAFSIPTNPPPDPANLIEGGKRPLSSITNLVLLKDGKLAAVLGGSGGINIVAAVTQVFVNHFVLGMDALDAVRRPRVYPKLMLEEMDYDNVTWPGVHIELSKEYRDFLEEKGHNMTMQPFTVATNTIVQTLAESPEFPFHILTAVSDIRKFSEPPVVPHLTQILVPSKQT